MTWQDPESHRHISEHYKSIYFDATLRGQDPVVPPVELGTNWKQGIQNTSLSTVPPMETRRGCQSLQVSAVLHSPACWTSDQGVKINSYVPLPFHNVYWKSLKIDWCTNKETIPMRCNVWIITQVNFKLFC